ncbi:MAG: 50S ribosomal protein L24 [bacterium]|nr:50S ribosomal protein L24 [Candidatus Limimorpha caballi]MCQ2309210.1 50S ribosomal protein L24 [Bacteroidales bacterium]MCQ2315141.1 50S ribosomal protein L24 [Bacteroidales bacterium]
MSIKMFVKKGDSVVIISGTQKGKRGTVLSVDPKKQRAIVDGVNLVSKNTKPSTENPKGGIIKKEAPIHVSNIMVCDKDGTPGRIGRKKDENGKSIRYSKKSGEVIK